MLESGTTMTSEIEKGAEDTQLESTCTTDRNERLLKAAIFSTL